MNTGFFIVLLTTLGDFGVKANPNAPTPAQIEQYAPGDADFMVHLDLQAVVPHNYKALVALPKHELVASNQEAKGVVEQGLRELEAGINMVKGMAGLDPINDLHSLTVWLKLPSAGDPNILAVLRGNFKPDLLDRVAGMGGNIVKTDAGNAVEMPDGTTFALKGGEIVFGTGDWVKPRLAKKWKATKPKAGSLGADVRPMLADKPFFLIASNPSEQAFKRVVREMPKGNVAADIVSGHEFGAIALSHDGVAWTFRTRSNDGYRRAVMASEGMLEVFRSAHIGTRGMAQLFMAGVHSYRGAHPIADDIIKHEKELTALVPTLTGDGNFKVDFKRNPKQRTLQVKATGKKFSDVVPIAGLLPGIGAVVFLSGASEEVVSSSKRAASADDELRAVTPGTAAAVAAPGIDVQSVYREVKRAHGMQ